MTDGASSVTFTKLQKKFKYLKKGLIVNKNMLFRLTQSMLAAFSPQFSILNWFGQEFNLNILRLHLFEYRTDLITTPPYPNG